MAIRTRPTTRREVLVGIASGAALVAVWPASFEAATTLTLPAAVGAPIGSVTLDEFMNLSRVLTDDVADLRDQVGAQYQAALDPAALQRLVQATIRNANPPQTFNDVLHSGALDDPLNAATAQQILTYWYTGLVGGRTADYLEALAWETLGFAVPASTKIGFPKWEERP
jgi:Membrane bound FAD containing D-sorbitol dehydrogenase